MITENITKTEMIRRIKALQEEQKKDYSEYRELNIIQLKEAYLE